MYHDKKRSIFFHLFVLNLYMAIKHFSLSIIHILHTNFDNLDNKLKNYLVNYLQKWILIIKKEILNEEHFNETLARMKYIHSLFNLYKNLNILSMKNYDISLAER